MSNHTIAVDYKDTREYEPVKESRVLESVKSEKAEQPRKKHKHGLAFNVISSTLLVLFGIIVLKATGIYDGMESMGKIALGLVVSSCYLIAFRRGLYSR